MHTRLLPALLLAAACGSTPTTGGDGTALGPPPGAVASFTVSPIDLGHAPILTALGNLSPPGHTTPTDHVYFYQTDFTVFPIVPATDVLPVLAPATGRVNFMLQPVGTDWKIGFIVTEDFSYYLDHVNPRPDLALGDIVHAGDTVGTTNPGGSIDLGAYDLRVAHAGFVNPKRYADQTLHYVSPWARFAEPLRSQLYAKVWRRPGAPDKDGKIDFGIAGHLVGDWFEESVPDNTTAFSPAGWAKTLAFVYDYYDPSLVRIAIGGTIAPAGIWTIPPGAPDPATVTMATGKLAYRLMYTGSTTVQYGLMLVQLTAPDVIEVEVFAGSQAADADFTPAARTYRR